MNTDLIIVGAMALSFLAGCREENGSCFPDSSKGDSVTLVASIAGNGDNGYNDLVLAGVIRFYNSHGDVKVSLLNPGSTEEAEVIYQDWKEATSGQSEKSVIIFASDDYKEMILNSSTPLDANQRAIFFENHESNVPENVTTFCISRYGVSYLAGAMAAESNEAHVVAAFENDGIIHEALTGFYDGYLDAGGKNVIVDYLAEDESGYAMPNKAYSLAADIDQAFIFPIAGGSNNGIYKYSRDNMFSLQLVAGMDVDCSDYTTRVPFSILVHIDNVIYNLLDQWYAEGKLPVHIDYGFLDKEAVELVVNPHFLERVFIFEDYYGEENYWFGRYGKYKDMALQKEMEHYEN